MNWLSPVYGKNCIGDFCRPPLTISRTRHFKFKALVQSPRGSLNSFLKSQRVRDLREFNFNISPGLIEGNRVYVSGVSFIGKIDLTIGRYIWKRAGLYEKNLTYEEALTPTLINSTVGFESRNSHGEKRRVIVNKVTGLSVPGS